jgi:hypothetical protein
METKAARLGIREKIKFAGLRSDTVRLMKGSMNVFLFPSLCEGFPLALIEAQAAGLRCLIANTVSEETDIVPELITRLSLTDSAKRWATCLTPEQTSAGRTPATGALRDFGIEAAINRLCGIYEQQYCAHSIA